MAIMFKRFFKGLRCCTHVFGCADDEQKKGMTIGLPTNVKHVAHIGWDGPNSTKPSWMDVYKGPQLTTEPLNSKELSLIGTKNSRPPAAKDQKNKSCQKP